MIRKTLFYIELPPPIHGMTYLNQIIHDNFQNREGCYFFITDYSKSLSDIEQRSLNKIFLNISIIINSWWCFFKNRPHQVYLPLSASRFGLFRDFLILLPSLLSFKKVFLHLHGFTYFDIYKTSFLYRILFKLLSFKALFICLCDKQKERVKKEFSASSVVVRNTINQFEEVPPKKLNEKLKLLYIGNISEEKGIFDLIDSLESRNNVELIIAGDIRSRQDKNKFEELVSLNHNFIQYVGFANEDLKKKLLKESHIFCMPSKLSEGSPISIIEAFSYGLPVIATDQGCISEMIYGCGYLINGQLTATKMEKALEIIKKDYSEFSKKSRKKFEVKYSKDIFLKRIQEIIDDSSTI